MAAPSYGGPKPEFAAYLHMAATYDTHEYLFPATTGTDCCAMHSGNPWSPAQLAADAATAPTLPAVQHYAINLSCQMPGQQMAESINVNDRYQPCTWSQVIAMYSWHLIAIKCWSRQAVLTTYTCSQITRSTEPFLLDNVPYDVIQFTSTNGFIFIQNIEGQL